MRSGVTLIELLVVITIILMMMGLAAQRMQSAKGARRSREAARALAVYLGSARSRAMASNKPCGVVLTPTPGIPSCVMTLQQCEVPAPYAGDSTGATATVQGSGGSYQANLTGAGSVSTLVHQGDTIQFNYEGPWYTISQPPSGSSLTLTLDQTQGQIVPWSASASSAPVAFRIYRQPYTLTTKSVAAPLQLPAGAVIDLPNSGSDNSGSAVSFNPGTAVYILFAPSGAVFNVYQQNNTSFPGTICQPIYLLVGTPDKARGLANAPTGRARTPASSRPTGRTTKTSGWSSLRRAAW